MSPGNFARSPCLFCSLCIVHIIPSFFLFGTVSFKRLERSLPANTLDMPKPNRATTTEPQNARVKTQNSGQHPSRENLLAEKQPSWRDDMMIEGKGYMLEKARQHKLTDNEAPGIEEAYDKWADVPRTDWCCVSLLRSKSGFLKRDCK